MRTAVPKDLRITAEGNLLLGRSAVFTVRPHHSFRLTLRHHVASLNRPVPADWLVCVTFRATDARIG